MGMKSALQSGLVDIARDFLSAHDLLGELFESHRAHSLRFKQVQRLASDNDDSVLFRLKERCHGLFRDPHDPRMRRRTLLDLAVGSLFHEAMKVRENLYQLEVYGPKVRELSRDLQGESSELFVEFERILDAAEERLAEAVEESRALLEQTRNQLLRVLSDHDEKGLIARFFFEHAEQAERVFERPLSALLAELHGDPAEGTLRAAMSYLESARYAEAVTAFDDALSLRGEWPRARALRSCAEASAAVTRGDIAAACDGFDAWLGEEHSVYDESLRARAHTALKRLHARAAEEALDPPLRERVAGLVSRLAPPSP